ncbi:MAG: hypothetical protein K8S16_21880 [Bacteroidales bacterium]|nr:hypothetical protein [Bacteroidales bacterium]
MKIIAIHQTHNSSVAAIENGKLVFALSEERLTKKKNIGGLPSFALNELLNYLNWHFEDMDIIAFANNTVPNWYLEKIRTRDDLLKVYQYNHS